MSNVITAYFKGRVGVAESLYQNDYGIVMAFDGIDLPAHFDCYFSVPGSDTAIPGVGADNRVVIPNAVLANSGNVAIHIPLHTGDNDSEVEYIVYFKVIGRARPEDDGTPVQMTAIEQALALLQTPIGNIEQIVNEALSFTGDTFAEMKQELQDDFDNYTETLEGDLATWKGGVESDIDDVESDFAVLQGQFDTAVAAVTTDTEVTDIRVGADGITDTTAGASVRRQFTDLKSDFNDVFEDSYSAKNVASIAEDVFSGSANKTTTTITITGNNSYKTYCFTASKDVEVYFDSATIDSLTYLSLTYALPPIGSWTGDDSYRYITGNTPTRLRKSENNLPTANNKTSVSSGTILCVTIPVDTNCTIWINDKKDIKKNVGILADTGYVKYESGSFDRANERLIIYIPTRIGYIAYHFYHYESDAVNADTWGIYKAFHVDDSFANETPLTTNGEWECAIKLSGRPDFSGGIMHGDEHYNLLKVFVDSKEVSATSLDMVPFSELRIVEDSDLLDPNDSTTKIANHGREYIFTKDGLTLNQSLEWKISSQTGSSYMAMFPVLKTVTDTYFTDVGYKVEAIPANPNIEISGVRKSRIYSLESGFFAKFDTPTYPTGIDEYGDLFMITDNNGGTYNKMYYKVCNGYVPTIGEVWKTTTLYMLDMN